jgi:hypothetical protein
MTKPIKPSEVVSYKKTTIPEFVLEAFNTVIARNFLNGSSKFTQNEVLNEIASRMPGESYDIKKKIIYDSKFLDVEDIYHKEGWKVYYDRPGYNESYGPSFTFRS